MNTKFFSFIFILVLLTLAVSACGPKTTSETLAPQNPIVPTKSTALPYPGPDVSYSTSLTATNKAGEVFKITRYGGIGNDNKIEIKQTSTLGGQAPFQKIVSLDKNPSELAQHFMSLLGLSAHIDERGDVIISSTDNWVVVFNEGGN